MTVSDIAADSGLFASVKTPNPLFDGQAVEQARLLRLARDLLVTTWPSVDLAGLAQGRTSNQAAARQWIRRQRLEGVAFTIDYNGMLLIPSFQLSPAFDINPLAGSITQTLTEYGMDEWAIWRWWTATNPWIEAAPANELESGKARDALAGLVGSII